MPNRFKKDYKKIEVSKKEKEKEKEDENNMEQYRTTIPVALNKEDIPLTNEEKIPAKKEEKTMDEFEKKLQLALEQEKEGLLNQNQTHAQTHGSKPTTQNKKEDPKYDEIKSILGNEIVNNLNSNKWEDKKKGFE